MDEIYYEEIFKNDYLSILYDVMTGDVSMGFYGKNLTEFEKMIVQMIIKEKKWYS